MNTTPLNDVAPEILVAFQSLRVAIEKMPKLNEVEAGMLRPYVNRSHVIDLMNMELTKLRTRANTPDSAAQRAMGDDIEYAIKAMSNVCAHNPLPTGSRIISGSDADMLQLSIIELKAILAKLAQPSDATAQPSAAAMKQYQGLMDAGILKPVQPRVDLTDEQIATGGYDAITLLANRFWSIHPKEIQEMGISRAEFYEREIRALLANTAHGKPEHIADAERFVFEHTEFDEMLKIEFENITTGGGKDINWWREKIDSALAAKKG